MCSFFGGSWLNRTSTLFPHLVIEIFIGADNACDCDYNKADRNIFLITPMKHRRSQTCMPRSPKDSLLAGTGTDNHDPETCIGVESHTVSIARVGSDPGYSDLPSNTKLAERNM